ncbi:MAG: preprotein translocase subunit SecE [Xanthomonadales bacterium]|nr:preprotein translocase subunit SecE [Xanthomonadales bacterium]MCB1640112.1 preprotein translocase subunit SecE [Xanthomonadales bacterium]
MSSKAETASSSSMSPVDLLKWVVGAAVVAAGVVASYWFESQWPGYARFLAVVAGVVVGGAVLLSTHLGRQFLGYVRASQMELRKVVWPTRQETLQTTLVVFVVVVIVGLLIWVFDMTLSWLIRILVG